MVRMPASLATAAALLLCGCQANSYAEFYKPDPLDQSVLPFSGQPQVIHSLGDLTADVVRMNEDGYARVGLSQFNGDRDSDEDAIAQAKRIQASTVVIWQRYSRTSTGFTTETSPTLIKTYSSDGTRIVIKSSTTTSIPYSIDLYDTVALFYRPAPRTGDGLSLLPRASDDIKQKTGVNYGLPVMAVRRDSPAYKANILPNDVILAINDETIENMNQAFFLMNEDHSRTNKITIWRAGQILTINLLVPAEW